MKCCTKPRLCCFPLMGIEFLFDKQLNYWKILLILLGLVLCHIGWVSFGLSLVLRYGLYSRVLFSLLKWSYLGPQMNALSAHQGLSLWLD